MKRIYPNKRMQGNIKQILLVIQWLYSVWEKIKSLKQQLKALQQGLGCSHVVNMVVTIVMFKERIRSTCQRWNNS